MVKVFTAIMVSFLLAFCGCGQNSHNSMSDENIAQSEINSAVDEAYEQYEKALNEIGQDVSATQEEIESVDFLVYEDEYVKISFLECGIAGINDETIYFLVDNKTDKELTFQSDSLSLDKMSVSDISGSSSVAPQSIGKIEFALHNGEKLPTQSPKTIGGTIKVIDFSNTLFSHYDATFINIDANSPPPFRSTKENDTPDTLFNAVVYESENMAITFIGIKTDPLIKREEAYFLVENKSSFDCDIRVENLAFDGMEIPDLMGIGSIMAGNKAEIKCHSVYNDTAFSNRNPSTISGSIRMTNPKYKTANDYVVDAGKFANVEIAAE